MNDLVVKLVEAYKSGDKDLLNARIRNLMDAQIPNPFEPNSPESNLFYQAHLAHRRWRTKDISGRRGKVQMLEYGYDLARILSEKPVTETKKEEAEHVAEESCDVKEAVKQEHIIVKLDEPEHMFGVIPEKKKNFLKKKEKKNDSK